MARKQNANPETARRDWRTGLRYAAYSLGTMSVIVLALFVYNQVDQFLADNPRFQLAAPSAEDAQRSGLTIAGAAHVPVSRIQSVFSADYGRSVYMLPLDQRRRDLLAIDWVKDATVSRQWPDRLAVRIVERTPVAFVQLPAAGSAAGSETALIDADGTILDVPPRGQFSLPVLTGIRREQNQSMRRQRTAIALRLMTEAAAHAAQFSEIDVSDPENVTVIQPVEGQAVALMLGNRNFQSRLQNFVNHFPEIHRRLPKAMHFDLRLDDRITAAGEGGRGG